MIERNALFFSTPFFLQSFLSRPVCIHSILALIRISLATLRVVRLTLTAHYHSPEFPRDGIRNGSIQRILPQNVPCWQSATGTQRLFVLHLERLRYASTKPPAEDLNTLFWAVSFTGVEWVELAIPRAFIRRTSSHENCRKHFSLEIPFLGRNPRRHTNLLVKAQ